MAAVNKAQVFRKAALENLDAPERLDQLVRVTDMGGWIVVAALSALLFVALAWSIGGTLPRKVRGEGMLIRKGGVFEVVSVSAGQITRVHVRAGDLVERGQVVAELALPELTDQLAKERAKLAELRLQQNEVNNAGESVHRARRRSIREERSAVQRALASEEKRLKWLQEKVATDERLTAQGLITSETLMRARREAQISSDELAKNRVRLRELSASEEELSLSKTQDGLTLKLRVSEQERAVNLLEERITLNSRVESRDDGRVIEIRASEGSVVLAGSPIINVEHVETGTVARRLYAMLYLPPAEGKKVRPGYAAQIAPSTIRREELGVVRGTVTQVGNFPATRQGMLRTMRNEALVDGFILASGGAPIEVEVELNEVADGLDWSSGQAPPIPIDTGTLCSVEITVETRAPINYVLPILEGAWRTR